MVNDNRGDERDPETGAFDPDAWFKEQFGGGNDAAQPEPAEPVVSSEPVEPVVPSPGSTPPPLVEPPLLEPPLTEALGFDPAPTEAYTPPAYDPAPTEAYTPPAYDPAPTEAYTPPAYDPAPTEAYTPPVVGAADPGYSEPGAGDAATELLSEPEAGGALDQLFGSDQFQEYEEKLIPAVPGGVARVPIAGAGDAGGGPGGPGGGDGDGAASTKNADSPRTPLNRTQKILLWVAGSLAALLVLVGLFALGTRIPDLLGPAPGAEPTPTPTPTPTETVEPVGPVEPGVWWWDELLGGECLEPYVDAWQDEYTVVDCAEPHGGQLVAKLPVPLPEDVTEYGPWPGEEALASQVAIQCGGRGVVNLEAASEWEDVQQQGAFAVTAEQWDAGFTDFLCFVSRASGEPLTGSLAVPPATE